MVEQDVGVVQVLFVDEKDLVAKSEPVNVAHPYVGYDSHELVLDPVHMAQPNDGDGTQQEHVLEEAPSRLWYTIDLNRGHSCGEIVKVAEPSKKKTHAKRKAAED